MNELINVTMNENNEQTVSARDLHKGLEVTTRFSAWVKSNFEMFDEGTDYNICKSVAYVGNGATRSLDDYELTINMAKELSMMSHTAKGKEYRNYFLKLEDMVKNQNTLQVTDDSYMIQDPVERAKRWIEEQQEKQELEQQVQLQAPKVEFAEQLEATEDSITIGTMAKLITQSGYKMGRNSLFTELRKSGLLISAGRDYNLPTQRAMNMGVFEVKTSVFGDKITHQTLVTVKGQQYLLSRIAKIVNEVA